MADPKTEKPMLKAAKHGDCAALAALLDADPTLLNARDSDGSTPLHCACWKGNLDAARLLLERGAEVDSLRSGGHYGTTPLHAAAHGNHRDIVRLLLEHGASAAAKDEEGQDALAHSAIHKATAAAKVLREYNAG
jgi:ankyrin repeat protein